LNDNEVKLQPNDLGIGISQVIPVIIAALLKNNLQNLLVAIEQPELHIHPALQVKLADLFIKQREFSKYFIRRKYFLIETHSEHLMLRFLRRIGETKKGKTKEFAITQEDINVYWCEPRKDGLKLELMPIDESGEFTCQWPHGFFEEREDELFPND
jgi:predicted ATPase